MYDMDEVKFQKETLTYLLPLLHLIPTLRILVQVSIDGIAVLLMSIPV